jgi:hypothetical protein
MPSTTQDVTKKSLTKGKTKALAETSELTPGIPPILRLSAAAEPVSSSSIPKPKPPVSKSGFPRSQVYVEIITKKGKTGKVGSSSTVEKESKLQGAVRFLTLSPGLGLNDTQNL